MAASSSADACESGCSRRHSSTASSGDQSMRLSLSFSLRNRWNSRNSSLTGAGMAASRDRVVGSYRLLSSGHRTADRAVTQTDGQQGTADRGDGEFSVSWKIRATRITREEYRRVLQELLPPNSIRPARTYGRSSPRILLPVG